jgi:hypothetical protein
MTEQNAPTLTARMRAFLQQHPKAVGIGLVAGSALALVAVAFVVVSQLRPDAPAAVDGTPSASASASGSTTESESAAPTPTSSEGQWEGYQLTDVVTPLVNSVWARVTVDVLNVRAQAGTDARVRGVLHTGDLLQVTGDEAFLDERSWVPIVGDGVAGWVATGDTEDFYLQPVETPWLFAPRRDLQLVASGDRVLAYGWALDIAIRPYEGSGQRGLAYLSVGGGNWNDVSGPLMPVAAAAGGEGGFVVATRPSYLGPYGVHLSPDGKTWSDLIVIDFEPSSAAWGPAGPIVVGSLNDNNGGTAAVRVDLDGTTESVRLPDGGLIPAVIEASDRGYVVFSPGGLSNLFVSADGGAWATERVPGTDPVGNLLRDVELVGNQLIAVTTSHETGRTQLHYGRLGTDGVTWGDTASPFGRATVDSISAGNGSLLALGWDMDELVPRVWRSADGRSWTDLGVGAGTFGGAIGPEPVWAEGRWVAMTDAAYASTDGASWDRVFDVPVPDIEGPGCPPVDAVTALDLLFLGQAAADCYGDTSLTFNVWSPLVDGLGGCCPPIGLPEWLAGWIPSSFVSPGPGGFSGSFGVYPAPDVDGDFATETWSRVTGHFFDPAAQDCQHVPLLFIPHRLESPAAIAADCERRFVVDRIVAVDAP